MALPPGPDFRYTNVSGGRGFRILPTYTFRVAVTVAFYLHTHTHTFRVAVTVAFAFYLHSLSRRFLRKIEETDVKFEKHFRAARALLFKQSIRKYVIY